MPPVFWTSDSVPLVHPDYFAPLSPSPMSTRKNVVVFSQPSEYNKNVTITHKNINKNVRNISMERFIMNKLLDWKNSPYRKPLILKGVRQVGKTWILKEFGKRY